ncbi:50S ribosomal protein L21 [Candidatus Hodgkinia cicadicola]|uniref:50S ribosomal protein L21 n=1 Tax=Candidatus Hodgkinia cicadicola TaxID=573658 RepID=A0ABX4MFM0_9HYPH|nr:50S ribosomal protein L21 [Candidatus Hodgkinia cicadicola]
MFMFIQLNNNQYRISRNMLIRLMTDNVVNHRTIVVAKVIVFRCGNDLIYVNGTNWLALGKVIGSSVDVGCLCCKFKRRKGYKRTYGYRNVITMVYFTKIIKL